MAYDAARAVFRAARAGRAGAIILEIARSEIAYTDQRPAEYVAVLLAAALREGHPLPLFIQGDHCQVNQKKYQADPAGEVGEVKKLIAEEIGAGFYNIDVDTLDARRSRAQPRWPSSSGSTTSGRPRSRKFIREREPQGVTVSVGAEIGEVGGHNSTVDELHAFMQGYNAALAELGRHEGISKISVQTGTSHGGVVLPDGSIADVQLDLEALAALSRVARDTYHLAGAVQHGASTLPSNAFGNFPRIETAEIHLATNFQNIVFDHPRLPAALRAEVKNVARRERARGAEGGRLGGAVLLQGAQEGDRPVQAGVLESAGRGAGRHRGRSRKHLRVSLHSTERQRHGGSDPPSRPGAAAASCGAQTRARGRRRRPRRRGIGGSMRRTQRPEVVYVERGGDSSARWLFWGAVLGAGLALLYAPRSGEETRRLLQRRLWKLRAMTEEKLDELSQQFAGRKTPLADLTDEDEEDEEVDEEPLSRPQPTRARPRHRAELARSSSAA